VEVIEEAAGGGGRVRRPTQRMLDTPPAAGPGGPLHHLLEPQGKGLRAVPAGEIEFRNELLGNRAAGAFSEHREGGVDLHAGGEVGAGLAVTVESPVAAGN